MRFFVTLGSVCLLLATGCGGGGGGGGQPGVPLTATLSSIQANIFSPTCAARCHRPGGEGDDASPTAPRLSLLESDSFSNLVNVDSVAKGCGPNFDLNQPCGLKRVAPGDPDNSYLIWKLEKNPNMPLASHQMPKGAPPLDQSEIDVIRQWITDGALNN